MRSQASHFASFARVASTAAVLSCAPGIAAAQGTTVFREVRIDLSGLPTGAVETRRTLGDCLSRTVPAALAGRLNPSARGAPVIVVRPTSVWLAPALPPLGEERSTGLANASNPDFMEGEAIIGGARIALGISGGSAGPSPIGAEQQAFYRTEQLCQSFAFWLARRV
jgi:hypothetical protein